MREQVQLRVIDSSEQIGFDTLLVDEEHSFHFNPSNSRGSRRSKAILFEGQPLVAKELVTWFDQRPKPKSIDYWEWACSNLIRPG